MTKEIITRRRACPATSCIVHNTLRYDIYKNEKQIEIRFKSKMINHINTIELFLN